MHTNLKTILVFLIALFGALFVLPKLAIIAKNIGLLDQPNQRKVHTVPKPLVGGIGMMIAATFASLLFVPLSGLRGFFSGLSLLLLIGFLDDFKEMGHRQKFLAQFAACILLIYFSKVTLSSFGNLLGLGNIVVPWVWLSWITTVFCVCGVINAINLIDGIDGLAGGISFIAFMLFATHAYLAGNETFMLLNLSFAGAVLGFLRFNWHPARLFMGDAGSLCLGFTLAFMSIAMSQGESPLIRPITPLLILAVPIVDTLTIMGKRVLHGGSPFTADKHHLHHIFLRFGFGTKTTTKSIIVLSTFLGMLSLLEPIYHLTGWLLFLIFVIYFLGYFTLSFYIPLYIRCSLRFKRKRSSCKLPVNILQMVFNLLDWIRLFRKLPRNSVTIPIQGHDENNAQLFAGTILNLSCEGFMAKIPEITALGSKITFSINETNVANTISPEEIFSAEHMWISESDGKKIHGYKFIFENEQQKNYIKNLLNSFTD